MWIKQIFNTKWVNMVHEVASKYKDEPGDYEIISDVDPNQRKLMHDNYIQRWIPTAVERQLDEQVTKVAFDANSEMYGYDIWFRVKLLQYTTYNSSAANEFPWHRDSFMFGKPSVQKLTVIIGLTDKNQYEGGILEIMNRTPIEIKLTAGEVVVFPSILQHRVTPVASGTRQTLVAWFTGPMWR
ncbi:2OG-Fe(II) oxygenase [bacterium]|nr:2OG-Fe(II) oxygenase [bacterium]